MIEGMVSVRDMTDDYYVYDKGVHDAYGNALRHPFCFRTKGTYSCGKGKP